MEGQEVLANQTLEDQQVERLHQRYVLSPNAQQFLQKLIDEDLSTRGVDRNDVDALIDGLLVWRGPIAYRGVIIDYKKLLAELFAQGSSVNDIAENVTHLSFISTYSSYRRFLKKCLQPEQKITTIDDIILLANPDYVATPVYLEAHELEIQSKPAKELRAELQPVIGGIATAMQVNMPYVRHPLPILKEGDLEYPDEEDDSDSLAWLKEGVCSQTNPEAFFPERGGSNKSAKKVCATCDVGAKCLQYALLNDERYGIWGGHSELERLKLKQLIGTNDIDDETARIQYQEQRRKILKIGNTPRSE